LKTRLDVARPRRGKLTAIVGANGAGKTTTLRAVGGTLSPWGGRVMLDGEDVTRGNCRPSGTRASPRAVRDAFVHPTMFVCKLPYQYHYQSLARLAHLYCRNGLPCGR
jgi:ABC-type multidrug transport system ATPase subunit